MRETPRDQAAADAASATATLTETVDTLTTTVDGKVNQATYDSQITTLVTADSANATSITLLKAQRGGASALRAVIRPARALADRRA